ncbi:unnamed protein product [Clonostachys solani]|uniref:Uncharacterized protein n=1 Tax=Clonostachys solani TaxID=160281 RepID=A0A9N9ZGU8_9HYPO|nr:unnamed protein product [Clonostachys solani]
MFHLMSTQMKFRRRLMWRGWRGMWNDDWIPDDLAVYPRCRLCRLDYDDGEEFIAVSAQGRQSAPYRFKPGDFLYDDALENGLYCETTFASVDNTILVVGCHSDCLEFATKLIDAQEAQGLQRLKRQRDDFRMEVKLRVVSSDVFSAAKRMFGGIQPLSRVRPDMVSQTLLSRLFQGDGSWHRRMVRENKVQRLKHIQNELIYNAARVLDPNRILPLEIWTMIAGYLTKSYGTATFVWSTHRKSSTVHRARDIWATYTKIDGKIYLSKLSNRRTPGATLLRRGDPKRERKMLYIKEDHIGIRNIFISVAAPPFISPPDDPTRWRNHCLKEEDAELTFISDGTVLQHYVSDSENHVIASRSEVFERCSWPEPIQEDELKTLLPLNIKSTMGWMRPGEVPAEIEIIMVDWDIEMTWRSQFKMRDLPLNRPNCVGYSACWVSRASCKARKGKGTPIYLVGLHAHEAGESLDFYRATDAQTCQTFWTYMPLQAGEQIKHIWGKRGRDDRLTLSWDTTLDRQITVGADKLRYNSLDTWHCIAAPTTASPDRLWMRYLDWSGGVVRSLAGPVRGTNPQRESRPSQSLCKGMQDPLPFLLHSETSLRNVSRVTACRLTDGTSSRVSGLVFRFQDGSETAVGNVRLDCLDEDAMEIPSASPGLFLGLSDTDGLRQVHEVGVVKSDCKAWLNWEVFPWDGTLVWWFDYLTCSIRHSSGVEVSNLEAA